MQTVKFLPILTMSVGIPIPMKIKNKKRPFGEVKWAWHQKSREMWAGPCDHFDTWVGLSSIHPLKLLALQSTANARKPGTELDGAMELYYP